MLTKSMLIVKRLFVFTDILDMLSFITLYRKNLFSSFKIFKSQTGYLSLNGNNYDEFVRFIKQHPNIESVFDCTKNQGYSFIRKIKELFLAGRIEMQYSKENIFEAYVNCAYYGHGITGIKSAANFYFGCDVEDLSIAQCALSRFCRWHILRL